MDAGIFFTCSYNNRDVKIIKTKSFTDICSLNYFDFVFSALENSKFSIEDFDCFTNYHGAVIAEEIFIEYVSNQIAHPLFLLNLITNILLNLDDSNILHAVTNVPVELPAENVQSTSVHRINASVGSSIIATPNALKTYIGQKAGGYDIFKNYSKSKTLTKYQRRKIICYTATFIEENFGFSPNHEQQSSAALAAVELFPCLKSKENDIDLLVNRRSTGFLQVKLKNDRSQKRKLSQQFKIAENITNTENKVDSETTDIQKSLYELRCASLPDELDLVKKILKQTLKYRRNEINNSSTINIFEAYNCFFICTNLISYDFDLSYPNSGHLLIQKWPNVKTIIFNVVKSSGKKILYTEIERQSDWDTATISFLILLRLLPPSANGNKRISRLTDEQAVDLLINFRKTGLTNEEYLANSENKSPYIVAIGNSKSDISQYMVVIDGHLLPLPNCYDIIAAVDVLFKLHFIFGIRYDHNLRLFWSYLQNFIYGMHCPVTSTMKELNLKIERSMIDV